MTATTPDVWALAILKGGASKTTTSVMLAFARAQKGVNVLLIDADPGTQGATEWMTEVAMLGPNSLPFDVHQYERAECGLLVPFVQRKTEEAEADLVIIDCPSEAPHIVEQVMPLIKRGGPGSRVITPCAPETAELKRVAPTTALVRGFRDVRQSIALTRVPDPKRGAAALARDLLTVDGYHVLATEVRQNTRMYADVFGRVPADTLALGAYADMADELAGLTADEAGAAGPGGRLAGVLEAAR